MSTPSALSTSAGSSGYSGSSSILQRLRAGRRPHRSGAWCRILVCTAALSSVPVLGIARASDELDTRAASSTDAGTNDNLSDNINGSTRQSLDTRLAGPALQLERQSGSSLAEGPALRAVDGRALPWQQVMVWRLRGRHELGWGLAVPAPAPGEGTAGNGQSPARGLPAAALTGADQAPAGSSALLLLGAGRQLGDDLSMRVGMSLPMGRPVTSPWPSIHTLGEPTADDSGGLLRGQSRVGLSLQTRGPMDDLRRGLQMRMELSRGTSLSLKPRRSRVLVELRSQW